MLQEMAKAAHTMERQHLLRRNKYLFSIPNTPRLPHSLRPFLIFLPYRVLFGFHAGASVATISSAGSRDNPFG